MHRICVCILYVFQASILIHNYFVWLPSAFPEHSYKQLAIALKEIQSMDESPKTKFLSGESMCEQTKMR